MTLNKSITHGKERRKKHRGSKAFDRSCRNHGDCPACFSDRTTQYVKAEPLEEEHEVKFRTPKMKGRKIRRNV